MSLLKTLLLALMIPAIAFAGDSTFTESQTPALDYNPNIAGTLFKLVLSLVFIVGMI